MRGISQAINTHKIVQCSKDNGNDRRIYSGIWNPLWGLVNRIPFFLAANHLGLSKRRNKVGLEKIVIGKRLYAVATRSFRIRIRVRRLDRLVGLNHVPNRWHLAQQGYGVHGGPVRLHLGSVLS